MIVKLSVPEMTQAGLCGVMRRINAIITGAKDKVPTRGHWDNEINGAAAEMAYAKWRGKYWGATMDSFKAPDVDKEQIRSTTHSNGHLIIYPNDNPAEPFVLVVTNLPHCNIVGWVYGKDAMQDKYWQDGRQGGSGSWWVPQSDINHIKQSA